jgi:hypothetical protein
VVPRPSVLIDQADVGVPKLYRILFLSGVFGEDSSRCAFLFWRHMFSTWSFHSDGNRWTVNVAWNDNVKYTWGCLLHLHDNKLPVVDRREGDATCHRGHLYLGVLAIGEGARYSMILFFYVCHRFSARFINTSAGNGGVSRGRPCGGPRIAIREVLLKIGVAAHAKGPWDSKQKMGVAK